MMPRADQQDAPPAATWGRRRGLVAASAAPQSASPAAVSAAAPQVSAPGWGQKRKPPAWVEAAARLTGRGSGYESFVIAYMVCTAIVLAFVLSCEEGRHWFIVPVFVCGVLVVADAVDWFRGRYDVFDPVGIFGVFGFYFFFAAPLIHVLWDKWMLWIVPPPDWRPWVGGMAFANLAGLVLYRLARGRPVRTPAAPGGTSSDHSASGDRASPPPRTRTVWTADTRSA